MHPERIDIVVVNSDGGGPFLRRIDVSGPIAAVTYSGSDLDGGAEIIFPLVPPTDGGRSPGQSQRTTASSLPSSGASQVSQMLWTS